MRPTAPPRRCLLFVAIAVPLAALGGFMVSGRAVALSIENPQMLAKVKELTSWPNATDGDILAWLPDHGAARLCRPAAAGRAASWPGATTR